MDDKHCGVVTIIGRPNTGKSTILNNILKEKVAIVSRTPQTTRNIIRGILTEKRGQIVFFDTPGMHRPKHHLGKYMNIMVEGSVKGSDALLHLVDSSERVGEEEEMVVGCLSKVRQPVILALNKIDLGGRYTPEYIRLWEEKRGQAINELTDKVVVIPVSGLKGTNIDRLLEVLFSFMPQAPFLYPEDTLSDFPLKLACGDIIREKLFECMRQEVPHSIAVLVDEITERSSKLVYMKADIFVERPSQKAIVIGGKGQILKKVGTAARGELEELFEKKVYLELVVKVKENWRNDNAVLKLLGYLPG